MQVTSLLNRQEDHDHDHDHHHHHEHDDECGCGHDHSHSNIRLWHTIVGVVFVINGFLVDWLFDAGTNVALASAMIGSIILGYPIVVTAVKDLRMGRLSINELVAIAVLAAFASGDYKTAGVVAFFMLMGEVIETNTAVRARDSIESLIRLTPTKARRIAKDGSEEEVAASQLAIGDIIRIRPGDNVAADGVIVSGQGSFNQATITGESLPADKKPGDEVFAGTQNLTGVLEIKVSRAGTDTTLGRVRELILAAEKTKLPVMKIVDQYMGFYTPLVLVIGALVWVFTHDLSRVISVFVVSCPCAFILATPTAMVAALSAAARLGILIKNVADIELAAKINAFVFDKTGTLTTGVSIGWTDLFSAFAWAPAEGTNRPALAPSFAVGRFPRSTIVGDFVLSNELLQYSDVEGALQRDATRGMVGAMDRALTDPTIAAAGRTPASVTNGLVPIDAGTPTTPDTVDTKLLAMIAELSAAGSDLLAAKFITTPTIATKLASMRGTGSAVAYPAMTTTGGSLFGIEVLTSRDAPAASITLLDRDELMLADSGVVEESLSTQTLYWQSSDGTTVPVSAFSTESTIFNLKRELHFKMRRPFVSYAINF